ncbi:MAG: hypothetical protein ACYCPT_01935 [Acidimicrobiales bacterium]
MKSFRVQLLDQTGDAALCAALPAIAQAIEGQLNGEFSDVWNARPARCEVAASEDTTDPDVWPCFIIPSLSDPQALAYHTTRNGNPVMYVGRDVIVASGGTYTRGSVSISTAIDHEVLETFGDEFCDYSAALPTALVAFVQKQTGAAPTVNVGVDLEICDPVQSECYDSPITTSDGVSVSLSNFVTPEWFRDGSSSEKFDHLGTRRGPGDVAAGGYVGLSDGSQAMGDLVPDWKKAIVARRLTRRARRARARAFKVS